jgi:hypothetical protein
VFAHFARAMASLFALSAALERAVMARRMPGPGRRTLYTVWKRVGASRYRPHQGEREISRRRLQISLGRLGPSNGLQVA